WPCPPTIVLLTTVVGGQGQEGTGFSVGAGRIVTNRHVVADSTGRATLITVKFAETRNWRRAHIVKLADGPDDLAIIQLDDACATHGSSGSPVFDGHGHVIGVVYGGPQGGQGRIVYAVPADRVCALLGACK